MAALVVEITPTKDYKKWELRCAVCRGTWLETTHDLWNVAALTCIWCDTMQGIHPTDYHGDVALNTEFEDGG